MEILLRLLLLVTARFAGGPAERRKIPALVREILAGVVLRPPSSASYRRTQGSRPREPGNLLRRLRGHPRADLGRHEAFDPRRGVFIALGAFSVPALGGTAPGAFPRLPHAMAEFLRIALALTARPVSVRIPSDPNLLGTTFGRSRMAAALLWDIEGLAFTGLLVTTAQASGRDLLGLLGAVGKLVACLGLVVENQPSPCRHEALGSGLLLCADRFVTKGASSALLFLVAFAFLDDLMGLPFVVGDFFGTLLVSEHGTGARHASDVRRTTSTIPRGIRGPVFFPLVGLTFMAGSFAHVGVITAVLLVAVVTKTAGGHLGAARAAWPPPQRLATWDLALGLLDARLFSALVPTGVETALMTRRASAPASAGRRNRSRSESSSIPRRRRGSEKAGERDPRLGAETRGARRWNSGRTKPNGDRWRGRPPEG